MEGNEWKRNDSTTTMLYETEHQQDTCSSAAEQGHPRLLPELGFKVVTDTREVLGESVTVFRLEAIVYILHELL